MPQIPNTNLMLTEAEIQAVVDYAYGISMGKTKMKTQDEEEFEIPEKYRETCKPGIIKKLYGDNPPIPEYFTPDLLPKFQTKNFKDSQLK